ncbi:non-selective voltage-gated ion channel VDAC2-like [Petromyzon marinus]|uniref:Voltage-dependent anion-selective channel protein 2-like n=1 Tax=Petromyzon marinus TaxID=7757 RepID=A0AAJ7SPS2_PETMA|nr:voltage-dependent anion-selective channel protein 2-like [Petromyzon marinus]
MARCEEKAPPFFESLGEAAREVFTKGYGFGLVKLDFTTRAASGVEFNTRGASHTDSGRVSGALETRYSWPERGLRLVECWSTDNCLGTRISVDDQLAKGLQLVFDTSFSPNTGKKTGLVKVLYARPFVSATTDVDVSLGGPIVASSVVLAARGWLAGYHMGLDVGKRKITSNRISLGYMTEDFQLLTNVVDGVEFSGSYFQRVSERLDTAVRLAWSAGAPHPRFTLGGTYKIDQNASVSGKMNSASLLGLSYTQALRPGVKLSLCGLLDVKNINSGGHKLGLGLELEA